MRLFCSEAMKAAHDKLRHWMDAAGLNCRVDPVGNLIGRWNGRDVESSSSPSPPVLIIGSHLDTIIDAGKYDGTLGVVMGLAVAEILSKADLALPFAIDVIGFCEEEGVRFQSPYIGSRALTGDISAELFEKRDADGISLTDALRAFGRAPEQFHEAAYEKDKVIAFIEPHIEQGPVLELQDLPVGIVTGVAGQIRASVQFVGRAGHAGTVPMSSRQDALVAASTFVVAVEQYALNRSDLVATVGQIEVFPNLANVIPAQVQIRLDLRSSNDGIRKASFQEIVRNGTEIARQRNLQFEILWVDDQDSVLFDPTLLQLMHKSTLEAGGQKFELLSGAGHDAAVMATCFPTAMLFLRCKEGISHHPDELATEDDVTVALDVLCRFVMNLASGIGTSYDSRSSVNDQ